MAFLLSFVNRPSASVYFLVESKPGTQVNKGIPQVELLLTLVKKRQNARL
jgi:hypothetical protein